MSTQTEDREAAYVRDSDPSGRNHTFTGWDPGPWPDGEDEFEDWQHRVETELARDYPTFDVGFERATRPGHSTPLWVAQCHECGASFEVSGPVILQRRIRSHSCRVERTGGL